MKHTEDIYTPPKSDMTPPACPYCSGSGKGKHSKLGVTSFILSILSGLGILLLVVYSLMNADFLTGKYYNSSIESTIGIIGVAILVLALISLLFGIFSLFQRNVRKLFCILGTIFSTQVLGLFILCLLVGAQLQ